MPGLFADGSYEPVAVEGRLAERVVAFVRRHGSDAILTVVPRLPTGIGRVHAQLSLEPTGLADTFLALPQDLLLFSALEDRAAPLGGPDAALQHVLGHWPVGLFSTRRP
jgi:(1->4)-alpha-D-glucan 1-alpha-D-glucosylmutase